MIRTMALAALTACVMPMEAKTWTLEECIAYAMENNISLQKQGLMRQSSHEDVLQSQAQLLPSLNFSTGQNMSSQPWMQSGTTKVTEGVVQQAGVNKVYYNGTYSVGGSWTVWNGNRNRNQVKANKLAEQQAAQDSITTTLNLEEQITQLYIQILYSKEAIGVNKATLEAAKKNEERGREMYEVGSISKADLSQLTATRAQDEYNVVQAESQVRSYTRQLKQLLQITNEEEFEVREMSGMTEGMALQEIPSLGVVYEGALTQRPELKKAQLAMQAADVQKSMAKAQRMPQVNMNASVGTNTNTMNQKSWGNQVRTNFNVGAGFTVSVPIFDQRQTRTAINKATIQKQQAQLELKDRETQLYSTIENYWIQANNYQNQFRSARVSSQSASDSYDLLAAQFAVGLKNITELQDGKARLLVAKQSELQSKYMTILNIKMLEFYKR